MKVVIVGAGKVGKKVAEMLSANHNVTVIDRNRRIINSLNESLDVLGIIGDGTSYKVLKQAGVIDSDVLIASTNSDLTNIVISSLGKTLGNPLTIARVKDFNFLNVWSKGRKAFGIDLMVCSSPLIARNVTNIIEYPGVLSMRSISANYFIAESVKEPENVEDIWSLKLGKHYITLVPKKRANKTFKKVKPKKIVLAGASTSNMLIAMMLESRNYRPLLAELNHKRALRAAEELAKSIVDEANVLEDEFWKELRSDLAIVSLDKDEKTLLASLLAAEAGVERVYAVIHKEEFLKIFKKCGLRAFSPEEVTAERIVMAVQRKDIKEIITTETGFKVVVIEVKRGRLVGKDLSKLRIEGGYVGPALSHGKVILSEDRHFLKEGDLVILAVSKNALGRLGFGS